jgi:hypothetical protein
LRNVSPGELADAIGALEARVEVFSVIPVLCFSGRRLPNPEIAPMVTHGGGISHAGSLRWRGKAANVEW